MINEEFIISICITNYNKAPFIEQAIQSALNQKSCFAFEIVIADNCSTDESKNIITKYKTLYPDKIKVIFQPENKGLISNFLDTIQHSTGKYIAFLDSDDYWLSEKKIEEQALFLEQNPDSALIHTNSKVTNRNNLLYKTKKEIYPPVGDVYFHLIEKNFITHSSVMLNAHLLKTAVKFFTADQLISFYCNDYPLYLYLSAYHKIGYIDKKMTAYRILDESVIHTSNNEQKLKIAQSVFRMRNFFIENIKIPQLHLKNRIFSKYNYQLLYIESLQNNYRRFFTTLFIFYFKNRSLRYFLGSFKCIFSFIINK